MSLALLPSEVWSPEHLVFLRRRQGAQQGQQEATVLHVSSSLEDTSPPGQDHGGPQASPESWLCPQHGFAAFVHTDDMQAGGRPGHCVDG